MTTRFSPGKTALALAIAVVSFGVALGAIAAGKATIPHGDAKFLKNAAADGAAEVELAQLARQKAMRDEVKQFADRMVADHTQANAKVQALGMSSGVELPNGPDKEHVKTMRKLEKLSGPDFDREYMHLMVEDHEKDVKAFRHEARAKHPNDVTAFAAATLPTLEDHLSAARATYDITAAGKRAGDRETGSTKR